MNEFVDFKKRGVELGGGFKNLVDVLQAASVKSPVTACNPGEGLSQVERYVTRFLLSAAEFRLLSISDLQHQVTIFVECRSGVLDAVVIFRIANTLVEQTVREVFSDAGLASLWETVIDVRRLVKYPLPSTASQITDLFVRLMRKIADSPEHIRLHFRYHEKKS